MSGSVFVLGTVYTIIRKKYDDDPVFENCKLDGYCDSYSKRIVILDLDTYKEWDGEPVDSKRAAERQTLRHEIVHAFLNESGLRECSHKSESAVFRDEEVIDWIALQGVKIFTAWKEAECLP